MSQDGRAVLDAALQHARLTAYAPGEFVGQESFMRASEILTLAGQAGIGPGVSVLDVCCGVAGPGRFITRELGCAYLGVDCAPGAIEVARERAAGLPCRFEVARVPPLPAGRFDVVLLLETMLAFSDKDRLLRDVSATLTVDGRFAFTFEEGAPLTHAERSRMPDADTVWLTRLPDMVAALDRAGLQVRWQRDCSRSHRAVVDALIGAFSAEATAISARVGPHTLDALLAGHRLWSTWLRRGRVRKFAVVAERTPRASTAASAR